MRGRRPKLHVPGDGLSRLPVPRHLSADARREWRRVTPDLARRRALRRSDLAALERYCTIAGAMRVMRVGREYLSASAELRHLERLLGLGPANRAPADDQADDELAEMVR
ncbi:MAG: P27 family phage terminase small subunit [Geminicoccaceae bacterium]